MIHAKRNDGCSSGLTKIWEIEQHGKIVSRFCYKLHLAVDANYELLVAFTVTKASQAEIPEAKKLVGAIAFLGTGCLTILILSQNFGTIYCYDPVEGKCCEIRSALPAIKQ